MEYNLYKASISGAWYNAPLFDSRTGRATSALSSLKNFNTDAAVNDIFVDTKATTDTRWFNLQGQEVKQPLKPGLYINGGKKIIVK
jgi:arabinogalactan endo-1,4-beta-galactosidase